MGAEQDKPAPGSRRQSPCFACDNLDAYWAEKLRNGQRPPEDQPPSDQLSEDQPPQGREPEDRLPADHEDEGTSS